MTRIGANLITTLAPEGAYLAFFRDSSTELTVKSLDANGDEDVLIHDGITVPSGTIDASRPVISLIIGDDTVPDESFTLLSGSKLFVVNGTSGAFTEIFDRPSDEQYMPQGSYFDPVAKLVMIATSRAPGIDSVECRLRSVATDGTGLTLINTDSQAPELYDSGVLWDTDRAIPFFFDNGGGFTWLGCVEIPFDGSSIVDRVGDLPLSSDFFDAKIFGIPGTRHFAQLDNTGTFFGAGIMPITSGSVSTLGWPSSLIFTGNGNDCFASLITNNLILWPVKVSAGASELNILRVDKDTIPTVGNMIEVAGATAGSPLVVIATA